jgi:uncharacterized lipoprotein YajG
MKKSASFLFVALALFAGCSNKDKISVPTNAPTTTVQPIDVSGKGGDAGSVGGLNKKIPGKK